MPPPPPPPLAQEMPRPAAAAAGEDHATTDEARPAAKCEICGSGENQQVMFSCIQCNGRQHRYCLVVVEFEMRHDWCCSECQKKANGDPKPIQGEKTEFQRLDKSQRNVAHQIGVKTPQIYENSKVKFIPREEAALLSRERPAVHYTRRFVARRTRSQVNPASPPNLKCSSPSRQVHPASPPRMKCISPSRQVHPASPPRMKCISPSRQVHPASPPNLKCSSPSRQVHPASPPRMKCISPSRQVHPASPTMKCISPSRQVDPAAPSSMKPSSSMKNILPSRQGSPPSPRSMKQSCSMKCVSPSRSDGQAFSLKRCAVASQNPIKADDTKKRQKVQSGATIPMIPHNTKGEVTKIDQQLQDQPKEEKVANADIGKCNSWVDDQPTGKSALNASVLTDADSGCGSGTKSLHNNIDMPVIISSSPEYARRPPPKACWTGCFLLSEEESSNLGEFKAYFPSVVSSRVCNIVKKKMPNNIQLKISPRMNYWPKTFDEFCPVYEDIALIFFSAELDCYNKKHPRRLEAYSNFVMKAYIDDIMLLIYSSEVLPPDSQWIDGESYLWGVFVKPKAKSNHAHLGSGST